MRTKNRIEKKNMKRNKMFLNNYGVYERECFYELKRRKRKLKD